jgi:magnesium transporter
VRQRPTLRPRRSSRLRVERGSVAAKWIDLLDPTAEELHNGAPCKLQESAIGLLLAEPKHEDDPRATLQGHGEYVFGILIIPVELPDADELFYQQVDLVVTPDAILTVRKTPEGDHPPYDPAEVQSAVREGDSPGMIAYRLIDDVAERYLDLVDDIDSEIDELEDNVEDQSAEKTRQRISELRHDLLHIRRTLAPMRDSVRRVVDDVVEVETGPEVFPHEVEVAFNSAYDKFLRAFDGLEFSRDLLASVRDYHQSKIANDQNDVMKRLTVIAALILLPTFIVGLYGQNFVHMPELHWRFGYAYSWALILVTTVLQLAWFRRKRWL